MKKYEALLRAVVEGLVDDEGPDVILERFFPGMTWGDVVVEMFDSGMIPNDKVEELINE